MQTHLLTTTLSLMDYGLSREAAVETVRIWEGLSRPEAVFLAWAIQQVQELGSESTYLGRPAQRVREEPGPSLDKPARSV